MPDAEISVLLIPPYSGHARLVRIPRTLENFQRLVGGVIQMLPLGEYGNAYIHEEGKYVFDHVRDRNRDAEKVLSQAGTELLPGDFIVGPMVLFGGYDDEGEDMDVTPKLTMLVLGGGVVVLT